MEDQPQRANAAQMASRRIKDVKGRGSGRRPGTPSRPSIQNAGNQAPQWAPGMPLANGQTPSQSIGGLFGGSVQAPGTFNFSGVPSFDFSQQKQGNSNGSDISDSGDGSGRFAGDDRATKRQFGGRPTISQNNTTFTGFGSNSQNNAFGESKPSSISSDSTIFKGFGSNPQNNAFGESKPSQPSGGIFSFGSPAPGNQPSPAINFNPPQASPAKPAFTFGASQSTPASPGNSFGSNTSGGQSGNTTFNQNPAQSQGSGFSFGSTASQQQQSTPFQFGSTSAAPASSGITFGAAPTAAAASNPFDNLQNAAPTSSSGLNFSTSSTTAQLTTNLFGTSARPANPSVNFGGSTPAKNMFSSTLFGSSQTSQAPSTPNLFGAVSQPPASSTPFAGFNGATSSAPNPFASKEQSPAPSNNLFGAQASQPASSGNLFGASNAVTSQSGSSGQVNSAVATPTNLFNSPNKPGAGNTLFGSQKQDMSQGNIVGNTDNSSKSTNDLFGNLNKPVDVSVTQPKVNGFSNSPNKSSSLFGSSKPSFSTSSPSLNANPLSSESKDSGKNASNEATANNTKNSPFSFGQTSPTKGSSTAKNIFSSSTSLDLPSTANQPPLSGMFPPLSSTMAENNSNPTTAPKDPNMDPLGGKIDAELTATREVNAIDQIPESDIIKKVPQHRLDQWHNDPEYKRQFCAIYRCRALQNSMAKMFRDLPPTKSGEEAFIQYMRERRRVLKLGQIYREPSWYKGPNGHKRVFDEDSDDSVRPHKRRNQGPYDMQPSMSSQAAKASHGNVTASEPIGQPITNGMSQAGSSQTSNNIPGSPAKKSLFPTSGASATESSQTSNKISGSPSKSSFFPSPSAAVTTFSQTCNSSPAKNNFFPTPGAATPAKPTTSSKGKRKAEDELTQDTEQVNPLRAIKTPKLNSASFTPSNGGSSTSAIFKGILNSPSKTPSLQETAKEEQPRFNPFGGIPVPKSPTKSTAEPPSKANAFKPAATPQSNMFSAQGTPSTLKANMFATNGTTASSSPNPFAPKVPSTSTAAPTPANPFQAKPASTSAPVTNPFQLKPAAGGANGATIKPPTFDSLKGSDPMEQFRLQAAKDKKKKLEEQMEKAKDKEWDEDEQSESDFERKWYAKQAEKEKQEQQESANIMKNGPKFQFRPSQDASSSSSKGQDETTNAASNSLFARYTSGNSAANSLNGSRASTPGPIGSSTGSVLDGRGPSQPVKNIFGHLSDTGSGKDDRDDDSDADDEDDSENKDPNYFPTPENGSGPGTPASETGEGIASAKKLNLFGFNNGSAFGTTSTSGASTPGRSLFDRIGTKPIAQPQDDEKPAASKMTGGLFDRISRDANGNPLRHISSEEKENTQPSTSNVFEQPKNPFSGFFNKSSSAPADQTWKQDSPIKFGGSSNTEGQSTPSVSVTAATPTKTPASLFSNLGGLNKPAGSSLFSGLNNSNGPAPSSVGFAFGAAPSATSSLFPSAATSRGTSPGATTDGASDAEAGPDAEHHEQINLTSSGPGEEDEEVVHEVRAKALRFETDEEDGKNKWVTAGLGPLRVLKHKDTGVSRVLLRGDPSGKIVLNKGILGNLTYTADAKTVKFLAADGKDLETYLLQVKTPEFASKLADVLNEVKAQN